MNWSTAMTRAHQHFKAADNHILLKNLPEGMKELTKAQQWLAEAALLMTTKPL